MIDIRHQNRINIIKTLFSLSFQNDKSLIKDEDVVLNKILENTTELEKIISKYASRYPIEKISKIDLAILKLSIYELILDMQNPPKVVIDEAVELAKEYGNSRSYSFINGVLGTALKDLEKNNDK